MTSDDIKNAAKDTAERVGKASDEAGSTLKATAGKVGDAASDLYGRTQDRVRDAVDRLPDASEAVAAGQRAYARGSDTVGKQVAKQPIEALLLAGAIGYLVGWATSRS